MLNLALKSSFLESDFMESKKISVSAKRQITIPIDFYQKLGIEKEVECFLEGDCLIIRAVRPTGGEFATEILEDLISQGYEGNELLERFKEMNKKVRPAVEKLLAEANAAAQNLQGTGDVKMAAIFGKED
ncbi:AbrB/MazE/SpoVT family DNA-binding domain-containing protein [Thermotalea metallivorans]|uniref:SpoVT-AbrB domain-containing protein n=1 Tax=Thermotalea metallivorans TaxID=520762 RepID=A0A140L849_9FIRM|nr:AbrB/MazE/SpoVT family DNA-binding domain-containing protein [Thermotalea metallivorans]KXG76724.1 hypothetical protein AN619_08740 [Thermotalea metallivorans]